ncbi:MAG: MFS transporter [Ruminococcaceae bacterium]|nr:MFS transporter [Oscillospiraceae bacterium]
MEAKNFRLTKYTCFYTYLAMSVIFSLPPMLFVTFRETYGISYTLLGTLVLTNFCTQLTVDLIFTFFNRFFNLRKTVRIMPLLTSLGLLTYAIVPWVFPSHAYLGLITGTIIFSIAAGLCEVLLSPLVAAIPSETPDKDMSALHSLYGYGVVTVVLISTIFFKIFGTKNWMYLTLFWAVLPIFASIGFSLFPLPDIIMSGDEKGKPLFKNTKLIAILALCLFLGSCAENTMTNWISGYIENALGLPKTIGDTAGLMVFAILLALTRTVHSRYGGNISSILLWSMVGASLCYLVAGFSGNAVVALIACILTGIFTSMLWPGTLILMEEKCPSPGVASYALMAAAGDFGASVAPQLLGIVVDKVSVSQWASSLSLSTMQSAEQIGLKTGMITASIFPILGVILLIYIKRRFRNNTLQKKQIMAQIDKNTVKAANQLGNNPRITYEHSDNSGKRVLFVGNSITRHGIKPDIGWHGDWGMAASSKENDYVHKTISKILNLSPDSTFCICHAADWERYYSDGASQHQFFREASDFKADIIIFRIVENCPTADFDEEVFYNKYSEFVDFLNKNKNAKIIITSSFWKHPGDNALEKYAKDNNHDFIYLGELGENPKMRADGLFDHEGVAMHPGDMGMDAISDLIFKKIKTYL